MCKSWWCVLICNCIYIWILTALQKVNYFYPPVTLSILLSPKEKIIYCMSMYASVCKYGYVCERMYEWVCIWVYVCMYEFVCVCMWVYVYTSMYIYINIYTYSVCIYVWVYVCTSIYKLDYFIYIYIYIYNVADFLPYVCMYVCMSMYI